MIKHNVVVFNFDFFVNNNKCLKTRVVILGICSYQRTVQFMQSFGLTLTGDVQMCNFMCKSVNNKKE